MSWTAPSGTVTGYKVQWKSSTQSYNDGTRQSTVTGTSASITDLTAGTTYTVRVTAYNATGDGAASSEVTGVPTNLTISNPGLAVAPATLAITEGGSAGTFTVRPTGTLGQGQTATVTVTVASGDPGAATVTPASLSFALGTTATSTLAQVVTVTPVDDEDDRDESVTVTATASGAGHDGETGTVTVSVLDDDSTVLAAGAVTHDSATLTITNHTGDWHYKRIVPATPADTCSPAVSGKTASLTGLDAGTSYTYKAYSDGTCTQEVTNDATDAELLTIPGQVTGVTVTSGNLPGNPSLAVRWTAAGGTMTSYRVQWRSGNERYDGRTRQSTVTGATAGTITDLTVGTTYTVRVTAYNATGEGPVSAEASGVAAATVPAQPTILTASAGDGGVTLSWTAGRDGGAAVTGWEVRHKAGSGEYGAWTAIPDSGAGTRRHTVTGLANGTVYRFEVRAVNGAGAGAASAESAAATPAAFCGRTPAVRSAIVARVAGKTTCSAITTTDLAGLTGKLNLKGMGSLRSGDFAGLGGLTQLDLAGNDLSSLPAGIFDPLTALTSLTLSGNDLTDLPAGVFDRLTGLTNLSLLDNELASVPSGLFDRLAALTSLDLGTNRLSDLPAGLFDRPTALVTLHLDANRLVTLPAGVFDELTALKNLYTAGNPLTCLPFIPTSVTGGTRHATSPDSSFAACGAGVAPSRTSVSVGAGASETYTLVLAASPNRFARRRQRHRHPRERRHRHGDGLPRDPSPSAPATGARRKP